MSRDCSGIVLREPWADRFSFDVVATLHQLAMLIDDSMGYLFVGVVARRAWISTGLQITHYHPIDFLGVNDG